MGRKSEDTNDQPTEATKVDDGAAAAIAAEEEWFKSITADFEKTDTKNNVCFGSSKHRTYYPEDPGTSRFGVAEAMNRADATVPNHFYIPPVERIQKPISTKGYGIGGLLAVRFPKNLLEDNPAPNAYQDWVAVPVPKKKKKIKAKRTDSEGSIDVENVESELEQIPPERLRDLCFQKIFAFGSYLSEPRFQREQRFNVVGVGYYDLDKPTDPQLAKAECFGNSPVRVLFPTHTRCNFRRYDKCFECDDVLQTTDYYRTKTIVDNPYYHVNPNERTKEDLMDSIFLKDTKRGCYYLNLERTYVCLCRKCYCRGIRGGSKFWDPRAMRQTFIKSRHCQYIHDHRDLPIFIHKTDCKIIRNLSRKEALMTKYYHDSCERVLKTRE